MRGTPFLFKGFTGGLNTIASPYELEPNETRECLNVVSTERGAIKKRYGSTLFTAAPPNVELDSQFPATISGTPYLIVTGGGKMYSVTAAGAVAEIGKGFTAGARWSIVQAPKSTEVAGQGPVYLSNGVDKTQYWSGATAGTEVKPWTGKEGATFYEAVPHVPQGKYMIFSGNRIWMTGIEADPSAVWFSETVSIGEGGAQGDPSSWPKTNVVRFDSADGNPITGIGTVGPYILIFKESKTWAIHNLNTGENRKISDNTGCVAQRSIVEGNGGTFFLTADQGVFLTNGSSVQEVSYNVRPTILAINPKQRQNAAGAEYNNHYYLSYATGTSETANRTLDFDTKLKSWWLQDLAANQWTGWEPTAGATGLYAIPSGVKKGVVKAFVEGVYEDSGAVYTGNGTLAAYWFSPWDPFAYYVFRHRIEAPFIKKRVRQVFFDGEGEIIPIVAKNFSIGGLETGGVVGADPANKLELPINFSQGSQVFANEEEEQKFAGEQLKGIQMVFGGAATVEAARLYALGVARTWSVGYGNNTNQPFIVNSYAMMAQFRKS